MSKKTWAIWREKGGSGPNYRHDSFESAKAEAERLARETGYSFLVLEVIGVVKPVYVPVEYTEI